MKVKSLKVKSLMSRSRRKTPIAGNTTARSDKQDKQFANRKYRRVSKIAVAKDEEIPEKNAVSNVYDFNKDGKRWYGPNKRYFSAEVHEKMMRK